MIRNGRMTSAKRATVQLNAITPSDTIEEILPNTSRCPPMNAVDSEEEDGYRANDRECGQATLSTHIDDGSSCEDYSNTESTTVDRSQDQLQEPYDTWGQGASEERTGGSHTTAKYISRTEEGAFQEQDGTCGQDISSKGTIDASTGDSNTQVKYISRSEEEDAMQEPDGACGQDQTSTGASGEGSNDSHTQMKHIYSREGTIQGEDGACGQEPINLIGAEATEFAVELLEDFTKECTEISKQQLDIFRQQIISEHSRGIFQQKTGVGRDFSSIFNAMSECRQRFTVQLVRNYCLMKEEMTEAVARRIATACLAPAYVEELDYIKKRRVYVGSLLKLVLRSGTEQIERRFVSTLQHEEKNMATSLECTSVSKDDMAEFAKLQIERHDYNIQNEDLPKMCIGRIEVEILNDNLFSSVYFSYSEHTHIENNIEKSVNLFFDTIRKSKVSVLAELELICKNNGIMCVSETLPGALLQDRPYVETLENIGIETIDMDVGSIVLTLKLKDENAFANLKAKCLTGSIGDVLCDLSKGEKFTQLLKCHSQWDSTNEMHTFKMTLHAIEEEVHFVKMRIEGDLFKDSFCNIKTCGTEHPAYICEELEITDDLLATLKDKELVPRDIEDRLRMLTTRRGKIHELLSNYNTRKDIRFQTLATNIKLVRESRSKEAYPVNIFDGEFVYTICDGKFTRINHMRGAWLFQQEISAGDTVDHILYDTCDTKYVFKVCETLAESGRRYATSDIQLLPFNLVDRRTDCVVLIASAGESPLKDSSLHHRFRRMIFDTEHMLKVLVIHENNSGDNRVDLWMNEHFPLPFEVRHVSSNDKLCLKELFGSIPKRRFPHDQHFDVNILLTGDTFAHENTVYRELAKEGVGCKLINVDSLWSIDTMNRGTDDLVLNVLITGKDSEEDFFNSIRHIDWFNGRNCLMIKPIDIDLCNDQWLPALKLELKGDFSYDVQISIDSADRFDSRNLLLQYRLLASSGLRCILVLGNVWNVLRTPKVIHSKATLQIKNNTGLLCLRNQFDVTRDDQMWPFKVKAMIKKHESPKRNEERTRTIIIRHLEGRFEYENKIYTEVVNLGLGCRIVSEFSDEDFVYPDTVPCVLIHKGVDLNNESLFGHTEKVWQVLILDMDDNSAENVHTLMKGLRYRIHGIDLENVMWPQELLKRLTGIQKTVDGTAYEVCISFDNCNAKHAEIVYKGLENIGHRCLYRSTAAHEKGFRHDDCLWLQKVPSEYIDVDSVYDVPNQQLKVLVNDKTSKGVTEPLEANTISISLEDTEWPEKVKAKLKAFKSTDRPLYQDSAWTRWSDPFCDYSSSEDEDIGRYWTAFQSIEKPKYHESALTEKLALSRSGKRSKIDERKSSSAAFQSIKKPKYHESALTEKLALSRSGYRSMIDETKSSSADVAD